MIRLVAVMFIAAAVSGAAGLQRPSGALDVSIVLDVSGSVAGPFEDQLVEGVREMQTVLHPEDMTETITVGREIRRTTDFGDRTSEAPPRIGDGGTRLFDAIVTAALERERPARRHVVVVLTDGLDTGGVIDRATRLSVLGRAKAVVDIVAISLGGRRSGIGIPTRHGATIERDEEGDYDYLLREITGATGGQFYDLRPGDRALDSLKDAFERARQLGK